MVRLVEVENGRVLAALEPPEPATIGSMSFSSDGRHIAVTRSDRQVHLWDLALIRRELDELGLAAGIPDIFGGDPAAGAAPAIDRVEADGADPVGLKRLAIRQILHDAWIDFGALWDSRLEDVEDLVARGGRWDRLGHWRLAAADYRAALARRPEARTANHALARLIADSPGHGDPEEAIRRARSTLDGWPVSRDSRRTLALALYRAGRFAEAAAELEVNIPRNGAGAGLDWLVLAMTRQRMDLATAARACVAEAIRWRAANPDLHRDLTAEFERLRREAEAVLEETLPDLPSDVFGRLAGGPGRSDAHG
jgi:hypothetical protein